MFHIREMQPSDFPFAVELANTMNWNMTAEDFKFNRSLEPNGCFVLIDGSEPVGLATCISYGCMGWFGNLVVEESHRKKGAGSLLVKHAVDYLRSSGVTSVGLYAYEHLVNFYGALGFKRDVDFSVLRAENVSVTASQIKAKASSQKDFQTIVDFDCRCFGGSREKLLAKIIRQPSNPCYVAEENGSAVGYGTAKVYREMAEVGPLVCHRTQPERAPELLKSVLAKVNHKETYMCLPTRESALLDVAAEAGFQKKFGVARMFLGSPVAQDCIILAESLERG